MWEELQLAIELMEYSSPVSTTKPCPGWGQGVDSSVVAEWKNPTVSSIV